MMRKPRLAKVRPVLVRRTVSGGPWNGCEVLLPAEGGTMVFTVGEFTGRYRSCGRWEEIMHARK